jgi:FMN-binding domain
LLLAGCGPSNTKKAATVSAPTPAATRGILGPVLPSGPAPVQGPSVDMQWGPVQVTITVKGTTVSDLTATAPSERPRSAFINQQAIPMLRQEVLQAKSVANIKNIYGISGATLTSEAFYQSLLAALQMAHLM